MNEEFACFLVDFHSKWSVGLFTSSIMLASFLFTMKSFVIQTVKEHIYDTDHHKNKVKQRRKSGAQTEYYGGLKRLAMLLKWTIILALVNSIMQISLSGFESPWLSFLSLLVSVLTAVLFFMVVWIVSENISDMIISSENKAKKEEHDSPV
jgi:uncharacterized membrane protein